MAITSSAKKALRVAGRRRVFNLRRKDSLRNALKEVRNLIASGKKEEAQAIMTRAYKALDKAAKTNLIKKGTASRKKSRLMKALAKIK